MSVALYRGSRVAVRRMAVICAYCVKLPPAVAESFHVF